MADSPVYVHVDRFGVKKMFDKKYKSKVIDVMRKTAIRFLEKSRPLTPKPPRSKEDKLKDGFLLDGSVEKFTMEEVKGKTILAAEIKMIIATWPKKRMIAFPSLKGEFEVKKPDKPKPDVEQLIASMMKTVMEKEVIKFLEKRAKILQKESS